MLWIIVLHYDKNYVRASQVLPLATQIVVIVVLSLPLKTNLSILSYHYWYLAPKTPSLMLCCRPIPITGNILFWEFLLWCNVKYPALPQLWHRMQPRLRFDPLSVNFHMSQVELEKKKNKTKNLKPFTLTEQV